MSKIQNYWRLLLFVFLTGENLINCERNWSLDLISVDVENGSPDVMFVELEITTPRRGVYGLSGIFDIKKDLTDELFVAVNVYYSSTSSNYMKTPLQVPKSTSTSILNSCYKDLIMESLENCTENAMEMVNGFIAPPTKRVMRLNNCIFSNENLPSNMRTGYYKIVIEFSNQVQGTIEILIQVQQV